MSKFSDARKAIGSGGKEKLQDLLDNGLDVNESGGAYGHTLLICAVEANNAACVEMLLKRGADRSLTDNSGWTAFDYAVRNRNVRCALLLGWGENSAEDVDRRLKDLDDDALGELLSNLEEGRLPKRNL